MSLSSSIEFESRTRPYRAQANTNPEPFFAQNHSRAQPPRVRYPTPDYDQDGPPGASIFAEKVQESTEFFSVAKPRSLGGSGENCFTEAPFVVYNSQRTSSPLSAPNDSSISAIYVAGTVPFSDEGSASRLSNREYDSNGAEIANAEDDEQDDDEFVVVVKPNRSIDDAETREADRFGFLGGSGNAMKIPVEVIRRRESKWLAMLGNWQFYMTKRFDKVRARCRKGIPSSLRPRAWKYLCGAQFFMTSSKTKQIFETLDKHPGDPHWNSEIMKDLNRQFPNHEMFSQATPYGKFGQEDLFRVLKAWTLLHPEEGYCQAQAPIAAALLMHMPAHEAFYCFAQICQKYLPGYYSPGLEAIQLDGDILFGLLKKHSYPSYKHLKKQSIDPVLYMVEWFMCIFCRTLPWPCVLRVLDMFFCEGMKILFKVGVFLFKYGLSSREQLNACPSMYETIERLRHLPIENLNEEYLVQKVTELSISDEDLERVHYKQVKARNKKQKQQRSHVTI